MKRKWMMALATGAILLTTAACNTVRGVGDDLKSVANAVDDET